MNPIMCAALGHIDAGKVITTITVDNKLKPCQVIFTFEDNTCAKLSVNCDHQVFMEWWKNTGTYIRLMKKVESLDNLD